MPYIRKADRPIVKYMGATNAGELNYEISDTINHYLEKEEKLSYTLINDVLGALEGAKLEFYRRVVVPYENGKLSRNGDVYLVGMGAGTSSGDGGCQDRQFPG